MDNTMIKEFYNGYTIRPNCHSRSDGRYSVEVIIEKDTIGTIKTALFKDNSMSLLLKVEAEKESINFGKNIIKNGNISF